jgi:hypothetical protein
MKTISPILFIMLLIACSATSRAQSGLTLEATQYYTTFSFNDSQGNLSKNEYKGIFTGAYSAGYSYQTDFGLFLRTGIGMRKAGANLVYDEMNYSWDIRYGEGRLGLGYMYVIDAISPYLLVSGYYSYMLNGIQNLNNEQFNIIHSEVLNKTDYGILVSPGVEITITDNLSTFIEAKYLMGLHNLEKSSQKAFNLGYGLSAGIAVKF